MKVYVVYHGFPRQVFLEEDLAKKYIEAVNTSPYEIDHYKIIEMETADEKISNLKIVSKYWFRYEIRDGKKHSFFLYSRQENSLDNYINELKGEVCYEETLYHNSSKARVRSLIGSFYVDKRECEIEWEMYEIEFKEMCKELMDNIIYFRNMEDWSLEQVNEWLPQEPFVIK